MQYEPRNRVSVYIACLSRGCFTETRFLCGLETGFLRRSLIAIDDVSQKPGFFADVLNLETNLEQAHYRTMLVRVD